MKITGKSGLAVVFDGALIVVVGVGVCVFTAATSMARALLQLMVQPR